MSKSGNYYTRVITIIINPFSCFTTDHGYLRIEMQEMQSIPITTLYNVKFTCRISGVHAPLHEHEDAQVPEQKQQEDHLWNILQQDHLWLPEEAGNTAAFMHRARHNSTHQNY